MTGASSNQYGVSAVQLAGGLWDDSQLRAVKDNRIRWYAIYRLLGLLVAHITVHMMHTRKAVPRKRLSFVLALHILVGLLETFRFALLDLFRPPVADLLDVALCLVQSLTNVLLVRRMTRGLAYFTPASYLSGAILRPFLTLLSYAHSLPAPHRLSVSAVDGFIYTRLCIFLLRFAPAWLRGSYGRRYAISVVLAGCMGFHAGGLSDHGSGEGRGQVPNGIVAMWGIRMASLGAGRMVGVYLGLTAVLALSLWTLDKLWRRENSSIGRSRIHAAPRIGTSTDIPCAQPLLDHVYAHASPDPPQALSKQHLPNIDTPPLTRSSSTMSEHDVIFATPGLKTPADELGDPSSTVVLPGFFTGDTRIPHAGSLKERRNAFENGAKKKASVAIQKVCDLHDDD